MRVCTLLVALVLLAGMTVPVALASDEPLVATVPDGTTLPVVLTRTIDTAKAKPGDPVRFELVSPVVANGTVIPRNAKLSGKIVRVHTLKNHPYSSLAVLIDSVEWKHNVVPLQAHMVGFGKVRLTYYGSKMNCEQSPRDEVYESGSVQVRGGEQRTVRIPPKTSGVGPQCDNVAAQTESDAKSLSDIKLYRTRNLPVPVAFVSRKRDIVLKKGTLLVIRNGADPETMGEATASNNMPRK